jgi:nucleoid DNA-binding protein
MPRAKKTKKKATRRTTKKAPARRTTTRKVKAKSTRRKAAGRKKSTATKRKATAKRKTTASKKAMPSTAIKDPFNKSQVFSYIAEATELSKKEISRVFEALSDLIERHLKSRGAGEFTVPGLMKCVVKRKPATKARKGINPFTGEEMMFKAKPARNVVKVRPLKKLKEMTEA